MRLASAPAVVVFLKECRESLRDRRVLLNALVLGPLLGPLLFVLLVRVTISRELEQAARPLPVAVAGAGYAPNLVAALEQQGLQLRAVGEDLEGAVRSQQVAVALRIPPTFPDAWGSGRPAEVQIVYDSSRRDTAAALQRLQGMLGAYARRTAAMRLLVRGLAPTLTTPLLLAPRDQATPRARGALLLAMLPYFLIMSALVGGMWLAIDATAGERERACLEPLLINPVPADRILLGKVLAAVAFDLGSLALALLAFMAAGALLPAAQLGMSFSLGPAVVAAIVPQMLPLVLLIVVAQFLVTAFARSTREAQTWLALLQLLPIVPSVVLSMLPLQPRLWMYAVPLLGQQFSVMALLRGEHPGALPTLLSAVVTLLIAALAFMAARRSYQSERLAIST